jgi:hypothetical protein
VTLKRGYELRRIRETIKPIVVKIGFETPPKSDFLGVQGVVTLGEQIFFEMTYSFARSWWLAELTLQDVG